MLKLLSVINKLSSFSSESLSYKTHLCECCRALVAMTTEPNQDMMHCGAVTVSVIRITPV